MTFRGNTGRMPTPANGSHRQCLPKYCLGYFSGSMGGRLSAIAMPLAWCRTKGQNRPPRSRVAQRILHFARRETQWCTLPDVGKLMTPPSSERRRQAIVRWLMRQCRDEFQCLLDSNTLEQWISKLDLMMLDDFEDQERMLRDKIANSGAWETPQGQRQFELQCMECWEQIKGRYLPGSAD